MASRFSSSVTPRAVVTWKSWVLPTRQTAGVPAFRTAASTSSFSADRPDALGHAEGGHRGAGLGRGGEEIAVGRVRARPAALDIVDPQGIEGRGDLALSRRRKTARPASAARRGGWCRRGRGVRGSLECLVRSPAWHRSSMFSALTVVASGSILVHSDNSALRAIRLRARSLERLQLGGSKSAGASSPPALTCATSTPSCDQRGFQRIDAEKSSVADCQRSARQQSCPVAIVSSKPVISSRNHRRTSDRAARASPRRSLQLATQIVRRSTSAVQLCDRCQRVFRSSASASTTRAASTCRRLRSPVDRDCAIAASVASACAAFSAVQSIGLRVMRHRGAQTGSPRPACPDPADPAR